MILARFFETFVRATGLQKQTGTIRGHYADMQMGRGAALDAPGRIRAHHAARA
jgi:hypothetical protein